MFATVDRESHIDVMADLCRGGLPVSFLIVDSYQSALSVGYSLSGGHQSSNQAYTNFRQKKKNILSRDQRKFGHLVISVL